ncbi:MAG: hypothetical protein FIO02_05940 [Nitrosopumilales archaeon]|nr:hypothetical protein [Thermoproteota archaeon]MRN40567.1 hypothetical protein [Nitrosopumilales archaeon]MRN60970.1 hypothetical protein [Nitrosopumilales archaeon]
MRKWLSNNINNVLFTPLTYQVLRPGNYLSSTAIDESMLRINQLIDKMSAMEQEIANETEILKEQYINASSAMGDAHNYFLSGVESAPSQKSYLLTSRGIEVLGEEVIPISAFIDNVVRYAISPKNKIEVLYNLVTHLKKLDQMLSS